MFRSTKLQIIDKKTLTVASGKTIEMFALGGSILDFESPDDGCIVNAANAGGITGFGIDELVNRAGGYEMKEARRAFDGIPTGTAKSTPSFRHQKVSHVIHACGPVLRDNALAKNETLEEKFALLSSAYRASMEEASRLRCREIAFCLLSAGVFRGETPLSTVIRLGLEGIRDFYLQADNAAYPERVHLVAYTTQEQAALAGVFADFF